MARPIKDKWLGARVEASLAQEVVEYIGNADMTMGQLLRAAVKEYMWSHPRSPQMTDEQRLDSLLKPSNLEDVK